MGLTKDVLNVNEISRGGFTPAKVEPTFATFDVILSAVRIIDIPQDVFEIVEDLIAWIEKISLVTVSRCMILSGTHGNPMLDDHGQLEHGVRAFVIFHSRDDAMTAVERLNHGLCGSSRVQARLFIK